MKIIQSFWTKPSFSSDQDTGHFRLNGGYPHRIVNYFSWALSCLQLTKYYDHVELVTDKLGREILINKLQLPYHKVQVTLNEIDHFNPKLWALGKLYAYGLQQEPFIHVDSDIFIWNRFSNRITDAGLVTQNREMDADYTLTFQQISGLYHYFPEVLHLPDNTKTIHGINAGILGGNNIAFIHKYVKQAFEFITSNTNIINQSIDSIYSPYLNCIFEQSIFYYLAQADQLPITYLFPEEKGNPPGVGYFHNQSKYKGYVHSFGDYKTERIVYITLEDKLRKLYPGVHKRIVDLVSSSEL